MFQENLDAVGDVLLQETFNVWDPKALIKKGRERHLFLFEMCLIFAKEVKDSNAKTKYMYKFKLMVSTQRSRYSDQYMVQILFRLR